MTRSKINKHPSNRKKNISINLNQMGNNHSYEILIDASIKILHIVIIYIKYRSNINEINSLFIF